MSAGGQEEGRELGVNIGSNTYKAARMTRWLAVLGMAVVVVLAAGCDLFRENDPPPPSFGDHRSAYAYA